MMFGVYLNIFKYKNTSRIIQGLSDENFNSNEECGIVIKKN